MSCIDMAVTTTFEHVRGNAANPYHRELQKDYGKAASVVIRLCKKAKIEGTNRIVIADSWFANLSLYAQRTEKEWFAPAWNDQTG